jgi:hypothetical protein
VAPRPADPFLIVDESLSVVGVSQVAEDVLAVKEPQALHRDVTDFLVAADPAAYAAADLHDLLLAAAGGAAGPVGIVLSPATEPAVRFDARIGSCGPPAAALIVLAAQAAQAA